MKFLYRPEAVSSAVYAFIGSPWAVLAGWLLLFNLLALLLMAGDKRRAGEHRRRVPENIFFLLSFLGGSAGALLGMLLFRHKTRHWYFVWGIPLLLLAQTALLILLLLR